MGTEVSNVQNLKTISLHFNLDKMLFMHPGVLAGIIIRYQKLQNQLLFRQMRK